MMRLASWILACATLLSWPSDARAEDPEQALARCEVFRHIRDLTESERAVLRAACSAPSDADLNSDEIWTAVARAPYLAPEDAAAVLDNIEWSRVPRSRTFIDSDRPRTPDVAACDAVMKAFTTRGTMQLDWRNSSCKATESGYEEWSSISFLLRPGDMIELFTFAPGRRRDREPTEVTYERLEPGQDPPPTKVAGQGTPPKDPAAHGLSLATTLVRRGSMLMYRFHRGQRVSTIRYGEAFAHHVVRHGNERTRCVQVRAALPARSTGAVIFIDGREVESISDELGNVHGNVFLDAGEHSLMVSAGGQLLVNQTIRVEAGAQSPGDQSHQSTCQTFRFDLSRERRYWLEEVTIGGTCVGSTLSPEQVRNAARAYLAARLGPFFFDHVAAQSLLTTLERRRAKLPDGAQVRGAPTGLLDTDGQLTTVASELHRQGVTDVVQLHLHCAKLRDATLRYTFEATRFDLDRAARADQGSVRGLNLTELIRTEVETTAHLEGLHYAMSSSIARSLRLPYARFLGRPRDEPVFDETTEHFDVYGLAEPGRIVHSITRLDPGRAQVVCSELNNRNRLHGHEPLGGRTAASGTTSAHRETRTVVVSASSEGTYLLTISNGTTVLDRKCLRARHPDFTVWTDLAFAFNAPGVQDELTYTRARAGLRLHGNRDWVDLSLTLGLARSIHGYESAPNWDSSAARGVEGVSWTKSSVILGPSWDIHSGTAPADAPAGLRIFGRVTPGLAIGYIDASALPDGLRTLDGRDDPAEGAIDLDLDLDICIGARAHFGPRVEVDLGAHVTIAGADDFVSGLDPRVRRSASAFRDPFVSFGPVLGLGWSL